MTEHNPHGEKNQCNKSKVEQKRFNKTVTGIIEQFKEGIGSRSQCKIKVFFSQINYFYFIPIIN